MADQFQRCAKHGIRTAKGEPCPACVALAQARARGDVRDALLPPVPRLIARGTGRVIHADQSVTEFTFEGEV